MENHRPFQVIVPPPLQSQIQSQDAQYVQTQALPGSRVKILSVSQALQFTPLTTSVLPAHDRITLPQICRARETAKITSSSERKAIQQTLTQYPTSKVKAKLESLLRPDTLPEYKFKQRPSTNLSSHSQPHEVKQPEYNLTQVAKLILDATSIDYKYPLEQNTTKQSQSTHRPSPNHQTSTPQETRTTHRPQQSNVKILPGPDGQMPSITKQSSHTISINLPKPVLDPEPDSIQKLETESVQRHKLSQREPVIQVSLHVRSQREAAEAAIQQFQNILLEVFEAQDQLDAGSTAVFDAGFFDQYDGEDDSEPRMSLKTMERLLGGLKKLVDMRTLSDISSEHLRRLQLLCEPAIDRLQTINLKVQPDADVDEQSHWIRNIHASVNSLVSANVCLHTVLGPSPDDSLLTTEALTWIPSALRNVFENCLIPAIEARPEDSSSDFFKIATNHRDDLRKLLETSRKVLDLLSTACTQTRGLESAVNPVEFLAAKLIFVQNALTEKTSALGIQTFEKVRKTAMSTLARIFARFPGERSAILDEVLTSLDKLPLNSRSARQYRLANGKSIQLISALFMQLVQNTALETPNSQSNAKRGQSSKKFTSLDDAEGDEDETDTVHLVDDHGDTDDDDALTKLRNKANKLFDGAARSAHEIVMYLVGRASKTSKTGDSPYRNLLDLFIEDMVSVLSLPEWPSSELMLRIMSAKMIDMAQTEKTAAAKNMALECLGTMGSAISTLKASLSRKCIAVSRDGKSKSEMAEHLSRLANDQNQGVVPNDDLTAFNGPFAIVSRHLWTEANHGLRHLSACGFFLAQYAKIMLLIVKGKLLDESDIEAEPVRVANFLLDSIIQIGSGTTATQNFDAVTSEEAELAYTLSVLNMGFCRYFGTIVKALLSSFSSDQAQVRSRSIKSVITMLETDSALLDRDPTIVDDVFKSASDDSAIVREPALTLIARFVIARPTFEQKGIQILLESALDAKVGVQKKAIGLLRDIYIKDNRINLKATISRVVLKRTVDHEDTVAELARKTLFEIWILPALAELTQSANLASTKVAIDELTTDIVNCISHGADILCPLLKKFLRTVLTGDAKSRSKNRDLCGKVVEVLFERTISNQDDRTPLMVLTSFAEADSQLIPPPNLGKLQPYLSNLKTETDLFVFKAVISIFSYVLPHLSATHRPLLQETQNALMKVISQLGRRAELDTVMSCLQVIDGVLQNTMRLVKLAGSIMVKIKSGAAALQKSNDLIPQLLKLLRIAGALAKHIDLEKYGQQFAQEVKDMKGRSVAGYMANTLLPLTQASQPPNIRSLALESLGSLCQAFPAQLNEASIYKTFFSVFTPGVDVTDSSEQNNLQGTVLRVFDELYAHRAQSKDDDEKVDEDPEKQDLGKLGGNSRTRDGDSAISMITGNVAKSASAIALSVPNDNALVAARTLASISHQGLNHPKDSLLVFVPLSTCPDSRIAAVAHDAHRLLHQQHESVCEREYMTAIHQAFEYQYKVLGDPQGAQQPTYKAKLASCFEVVNNSGTKFVKKFLSGLVSRVSAKLSVQDGSLPMNQVLWTLFAVQNLVFFEFSKIDEVYHTVLQLELAYSKKGVEISQLLEAALSSKPMLETDVQMEEQDQTIKEPNSAQSTYDVETIRRLAPLAATLTIMMEGRSYLKRQYGIGRDVRTAISNNKQAKDTAKAPTKIHGITGAKFWTNSNAAVALLQDDTGLITCCQDFVLLMSMDDEITVEDDVPTHEPSDSIVPGEVRDFARAGTPAGIKRKLSASATSTPAKRGRPRKESRRSASISSMDDPDADFAG